MKSWIGFLVFAFCAIGSAAETVLPYMIDYGHAVEVKSVEIKERKTFGDTLASHSDWLSHLTLRVNLEVKGYGEGFARKVMLSVKKAEPFDKKAPVHFLEFKLPNAQAVNAFHGMFVISSFTEAASIEIPVLIGSVGPTSSQDTLFTYRIQGPVTDKKTWLDVKVKINQSKNEVQVQ